MDAEKIISLIEARGDVVQVEDGDWVYFPSQVGFLKSWELRVIADYLEEKNSEIELDFGPLVVDDLYFSTDISFDVFDEEF